MKTIKLYKRKEVALVDDDFDESGLRWRLSKAGVIATSRGTNPIRLHRFIMQPQGSQQVSFRNGNLLDCRRENLFITTHKETHRRTRKHKATYKNPYMGVSRLGKVFAVRLFIGERKLYCGTYKDAETAARMYDLLARIHLGKDAFQNFPVDDT